MMDIIVKYDETIPVWVAYLPSLSVFSQGNTKERAVENLADALHGFVDVAYRNNFLAKCFNIKKEGVDNVS